MKPRARSSWTSTAPGGVLLSGAVGDLFVHHTAGALPVGGVDATPAAEVALIRATREFHTRPASQGGRGMTDIAYSYGFMPSGRAYELRGHRTGGHTFCCNSTSIAFLFFGHSEIVPGGFLDLAVRAMHEERLRQAEMGNLTPDHRLRGHRDVGGQFGSTACPGEGLYRRLAEIEKGEDMGFAEYSEAYAERWNRLIEGEARPRLNSIPMKNPLRRDAALGRRQADVDFVTYKALRKRASG